MLALKDRANLALGYAYLQANDPAKARVSLERVRLNGPYSNKALLGTGYADAQLGDYKRALSPWLELRNRNLLDSAVQESYIAVPYAFAQLGANSQSAEYYEGAVESYDKENVQLDQAIDRIRQGSLLKDILAGQNDPRHGWFWQLKKVPDAPESRYLYTILAGHDFQEGLKNYRDLVFMGHTLDNWDDSMEAFSDMIDTRERAYAERLPRTDALLSFRSGGQAAAAARRAATAPQHHREHARCGCARLGGGARRSGRRSNASKPPWPPRPTPRRMPSCATGCGSPRACCSSA